MIFPEKFEEKINFDSIRQMLLKNCLGDRGRNYVEDIRFISDFDKLKAELTLTNEFRNILLNVFGYPSAEYYELTEELLQIQIPGTFLPCEILVLLNHSYSVYIDSINFLQELPENNYLLVKDLIRPFSIEEAITRQITKIIEPDGRIRDNASPILHEIRKEMAQMGNQIDKRINAAINQAKQNKIIPAETEIVIRNGQAAIPVTASNKRKISGIIIDESATGQTSYIQPTEVFELLSRVRELELAEKREIVKILIELADQLRPQIFHINSALKFLGRLDFLRSKALLAIETGALLPRLNNTSSFNWLQARHPLLSKSLKKQNREIVPADISLNSNQRILIISGPNAGGKSVCLKTAGLLQYMLQGGLLIPVLDTSDAGIFNHLFIDIGDQQSIENDLSTYTSHLKNIKTLIEIADENTLFLIDEFGAGTEPQSGGAIAEAILESLNKRKARGLVTTHYANLKQLASKHEGFINGAMLYDTKNMLPMYVLRIGKPGSSFAFEIAASIKLPEEILQNASEKVGASQLDFDKQMQELEAEKVEISRKEKQLQKADEMLSELISKYTNLQETLTSKKNEIIESAKLEGQRIIGQSNKLIEKTIREIKQTQAESLKTKELRAEIKEFSSQFIIPTEKPASTIILKQDELEVNNSFPLKIGSRVRILGQTESGDIIEINGKEAVVAFSTVTLKIPLEKLEVLAPATPKKKEVNRGIYYQNMVNDMNARMANFRLTIDLRGKRAEETETLIQKYIDEAVMLHVPEVSILHGKGNGILRNIVRNYLSSIPEVKKISDAPLESGGAGITVVSLKF